MIRPVLGWVIGIAAVAVVTVAAALVMLGVSTALDIEVNDFFSNAGPDLEEEVYRHYDELSQRSYFLALAAKPVLLGSVVGVFALLAVLARRWDLTR